LGSDEHTEKPHKQGFRTPNHSDTDSQLWFPGFWRSRDNGSRRCRKTGDFRHFPDIERPNQTFCSAAAQTLTPLLAM